MNLGWVRTAPKPVRFEKSKVTMATYRQIQEYIRGRHDVVVQTCWIADIKEQANLPVRVAPNRRGAERVKPCPADKKAFIEEAFRYFGMTK